VRYFDTTALVKQYLHEAGSKIVLQLLKTDDKVYTASLTYAETHAAFSRRNREGRLTRETTRRIALRFDKDWKSYDIVVMSENVLRLARQVLYRHSLRSADAIHLASALLLAQTSPTAPWASSAPTAASAMRPKPRVSNRFIRLPIQLEGS
jgi:predicted nucleic acid-binding protein